MGKRAIVTDMGGSIKDVRCSSPSLTPNSQLTMPQEMLAKATDSC